MSHLDVPVAAGRAGEDVRGAAGGVQAGDPMNDLLRQQAAVAVEGVAADAHDLGGVREINAVGAGGPDGAADYAAVAAIDGDVTGPGAAIRADLVRDGALQAWLVAFDQEGDRLRRFRARLPCEVVVTAVTHPLHGCRLRAYAVRHVDGVPHLKVELPDGMPGLVAAEATDALGAEPGGTGAGLVLDGDGLRRLRAVVMRLRDGDAPGPGR